MTITFVFIPFASDPLTRAWCKEICWRVHRTLIYRPWEAGEAKRVLRMPREMSAEEALFKNKDEIDACQHHYRVYVQNIHVTDHPDPMHIILIREPALDPAFFADQEQVDPNMVFWRMVVVALFVIMIAWAVSVPLPRA